MSIPTPTCPTPAKHRHAYKAAAERQLESLEAAGKRGPDWHAYKCPCGSWHVGHKPGALDSRIKAALRRNDREDR